MQSIVIVLVLLIAIQLLSFWFNKYLFQIKTLRYLIWPGIFFHELCHYLACKLTLAKVSEFKVGWRQGAVVHGRSAIPIVGGMLISLAPLIGGIAAMLGLFLWQTGFSLNEFNQLINQGNPIEGVSWVVSSIDFISWQYVLFVYLFINLLATFAPSKQDYKNIALGLIVYIILSIFISSMAKVNLALAGILLIVVVVLLVATALLRLLLLLKTRIF